MSARVGLLGGSFDPVHTAHVELARRAQDQLQLDRVLFIPTVVSLHKRHAPPASAEHRLAMLELALRDESGFEVSTIELDTGEPQASVDTVRRLISARPRTRFWFLMGADALRSLPGWVRPEELASLVRLGVYARGDEVATSEVRGARIDWIRGPRLAVSSREIRDRVAADTPTPELDPAVRAYIDRHRLYRSETTA